MVKSYKAKRVEDIMEKYIFTSLLNIEIFKP